MSKPVRVGTALIALLILILPALWNGFPLLEYDTGGYLARWFEGTLVESRSTVYGLFLASGWPLDFWPTVILQAAAAVWILTLVLRTHRLGDRPLGMLLLTAMLAAATALSWLASLLLTDIFAGLSVLALHLIVFRSDQLQRSERVGLVLFIAFAAATHSATFAVLLGLSIVAMVAATIDRTLISRRAAARAVGAVVLGAGLLLTANYAVANRVAWTPGGFGIPFGRMLQDGIVKRYLDEHCPDPRLRLCPFRDVIPQDADKWFWEDPLFNQLGRFDGLNNDMRIIVLESLRDYPWMEFSRAVEDTATQLVSVKTGEGVINEIWHTYGIMEKFTPSVLPAMRAARQQRGNLPFGTIDIVHVPVALASMALLPAVMLLGWRRRNLGDLGLLAATVAVALLGNAVVCGVLANPHDRYGSRIVWIAPLVVGLAGWRLRVHGTVAQAAPISASLPA